ncbi:MAG: hypothetical protein GX851_06245 [Clostridiales bacterium]|nr:hypothetical protein [Clostridiales bacterium]
MKKTISMVLAIVMLCALAVPAMAANGPITAADQSNNDMTVTYTVTSDYTVNIPEDVTLTDQNETAGSAVELKAGAILPFGESLTVKISSDNFDTTWRMKDGENANYLAYAIKNGESALTANNAIILTSAAGTDAQAGVSTTLKFTAVAPTIAGTYVDTLTFTVAVAVA